MYRNRFITRFKVINSLFVLALTFSSCADALKDINHNNTQLNEELMKGDNFKMGAFFPQMQEYVNPVQENAYQMNNNLIGDIYGRYMSITKPDFSKNGFGTFNAPANWINSPFNDVFTKIYGAWTSIKGETNGEGVNFEWAQILRVAAFQRITDMYGPIPYSKVGAGGTGVAYDTQEEVYKAMFADLTKSIDVLTGYVLRSPGTTPMKDYDEVYGGDFQKWVKFANSLKLRMAMRIVYADPELARKMAEEAVNHSIGVIKANADNAAIAYPKNPINIMWDAYSDTRVGADIVAYMDGYKDPRMSKYFQTSKTINGKTGYYGIRTGINITNLQNMLNYSAPAASSSDKLLWLNAAEVAFLRSEGAMRGWNMGGTDESLYNEGIRLSFEERGLTGAETYYANNTLTPGNYTDPYGTYSASATSTITIKWNAAANTEAKLERIITQKWIAMWPLGQEAWSEQRRTGYPKFLPTLVNYSDESDLKTKLAARIPFPPKELENNAKNYADAVVKLGGLDKYGTRLWWDKKNK
ncbi:RagB/SusD family nutrient uptake outer membrane protein [Pedobacter gandavensis]|uniref:RagB/SusD family nutrient uptake outer membrane protein n=1 Tax=Pedobacter gandavensis TaxID=2679963 RepID=UPI002478CFB2|nr:RagB/SusD family nutrient uptake outer membrane protein [Pedobacter gandavensis]WGQ11561.1 RagB/SusD family nutrient uptake outer membrane protein [Pedobacter gandavensis]